MNPTPIPAELTRGWLTADVPAIPGTLRDELSDFRVEEVPLYEPAGEGEHLYLRIEKTGISTDEAIRRIARTLGVPRARIGHAGLKDARAIAVQSLSIQGAVVHQARQLEGLEGVRVLEAKLHRNKLKVGHLAGNRFQLVLRGAGPHEAAARTVLERLAATGAAAYFGLQRFGRDRTTHRLGEALVHDQAERFIELLLFGPGGRDGPDAAEPTAPEPLDDDDDAEEAPAAPPPQPGRVAEARALLRKGDLEGAARAMPMALASEHAALRCLAQGRGAEAAIKAVPLRMRSFYVAAFQAWLFDGYLDRRLARGALGTLEAGEIATLHRNGASFHVEDAATETGRAATLELSPSGPMFGSRLLRPRDGSTALQDEEAVLAARAPGLDAELTPAFGAKPQGERRALRIPVREVSVSADGADLKIGFLLPRGCYATTVLEELVKRRLD